MILFRMEKPQLPSATGDRRSDTSARARALSQQIPFPTVNWPRLLRLHKRYILFIVILWSKRPLSSLLVRVRVLRPYISRSNFCLMSDKERSVVATSVPNRLSRPIADNIYTYMCGYITSRTISTGDIVVSDFSKNL